MNKSPSVESNQGRSEASIRRALDAVDRSEVKSRLLIGLVIVGVVALAIWLDAGLRSSAVPDKATISRAVAVIVAMVALATLKLRNQMTKNTQAILRAIAELDSKSRRTS